MLSFGDCDQLIKIVYCVVLKVFYMALLWGFETMDANCCKRAECGVKFADCTIFLCRVSME